MRRDIETIMSKLAVLKAKGLLDLALTTNGYFLPDRAQSLKESGLDRITISLDSLKRDVFKQMTGVDVLDRVLSGIEAAKKEKGRCKRFSAVGQRDGLGFQGYPHGGRQGIFVRKSAHSAKHRGTLPPIRH
jgi:cyclic pyranopterin phosphate synthase